MKLNAFETLLMNNPIRAMIQRHYEVPRLKALLAHPTQGAAALVIGCGRGVDIELAFESFGAASVVAIDFDDAQVERARRRLGDRFGEKLRLEQGDASALKYPEVSFDVIFDFGIIHHVPLWQNAVREAHRLLRSGGQFVFEEIPKMKLDSIHYRTFTDHPRTNRFSPDDFRAECVAAGFDVGPRFQIFWGFFRGCAVKP